MRYRIPVLALLLIFALSACNLGSDDDATPTVDTQTLSSPTPTGKPTVSIISPQTGSEVVVNSPILMSVNATDTVGVTRVQLLVEGQIARTFSSENATGDTNKNLVIDYTPRASGNIILQVIAYRGPVASDPAEITVVVRGSQTQITATAQPDTGGIPTIDPFDTTCRALINTALNFRTGPSTDYDRIRTLSYGEMLPIIGRIGDNTWLQLRDGSFREGWVSADYVATYGNCNSVPIVQGPATPTSQNPPTATATTSVVINTATSVPPTSQPTDPPQPNLVVTNIDGPSTVTIPSGETTVDEPFNVNVTNLGGALDTQFSTVAIILPNGTQFDVGVVANLGAGQSISLGTTITFDAPGVYALQFTVDADLQIDESSEIDNSVVFNVTVVNE